MLYLFGFIARHGTTDGGELQLPAGVLGEPRLVPLDGDHDAIVAMLPTEREAWDDASAEQTAAAVLHHDAVLTACLALDVAPARFGTLVDDRAALDAVGERHSHEIAATLTRLRGRREFEVRIPERRPVATSGADYLRRRRDELTGAADDDLRLVRDVAADVVERRTTRGGRRFAVLVNDDELTRLRDRLGSVEGGDVRGPFPPYAFSGRIGGDGG